jgi:5'-methylthioadenosine phosphorylase
MNPTRNRRSVGIISGTGVTEHFEVSDKEVIRTEFGSVEVYLIGDGSCLLPRHGLGHTIPPHMVNYRANIAALNKLGVRRVIATSAVGSMNPRFRVGQLGTASQFLDFTKRRVGTFFDTVVKHTDVTLPYSPRLNSTIQKVAKRQGIVIHPDMVYVCLEGPRFETAAEIRMLRMLGGDVVGMTGIPEVVLADELGMEYSTILVATNWAAGLQEKVSHEEVLEGMRKTGPKVKTLIEATVRELEKEGSR